MISKKEKEKIIIIIIIICGTYIITYYGFSYPLSSARIISIYYIRLRASFDFKVRPERRRIHAFIIKILQRMGVKKKKKITRSSLINNDNGDDKKKK